MSALRKALEPRCNRLFRHLNRVPDATGRLVKLQGDLLDHEETYPRLKQVDDDLKRLLLIWFNLGFLSLRRISWDSPASTLEKLIEYEAVHEIRGWGDLRSRLKDDRRLFAYFHPAMPDDPIIFVQVALKAGSSDAIGPLVQEDRLQENPALSDTATFYSISNCHKGLRGISFGNFLIKQVASELRHELPHLKRFETLSPVPGFRPWVSSALQGEVDHKLPEPVWDRLVTYLEDMDDDFASNPLMEDTLRPLCAHYLLNEKRGVQPVDPVARFTSATARCWTGCIGAAISRTWGYSAPSASWSTMSTNPRRLKIDTRPTSPRAAWPPVRRCRSWPRRCWAARGDRRLGPGEFS